MRVLRAAVLDSGFCIVERVSERPRKARDRGARETRACSSVTGVGREQERERKATAGARARRHEYDNQLCANTATSTLGDAGREGGGESTAEMETVGLAALSPILMKRARRYSTNTVSRRWR